MVTSKLKNILDYLEYWDQWDDDIHSIVNPSHHLVISDTLNTRYGYARIKNSFKTITRQFLIQLKTKYREIQKTKNISLFIRINDNVLLDGDFLLFLMNTLKIDKITLYDSKEPEKAFVFMFVHKNVIYYGGIASRVIDEDSKDEYKNFLNIKFTRKKSLRNI
jgi:hypothetical protein